MVESYDFVEDVNAKKLAWSFKVHVVRIWEVPNRFNLKELNSIEMVLQDSKASTYKLMTTSYQYILVMNILITMCILNNVYGGRIQASILKSLVKKWRVMIIEFQIYTMSNFIVIKKTNPMKRVTPGTWVLTFSHRTRVDHVVNPCFPLQPFRFRTIPQLINAEAWSTMIFLILLARLLRRKIQKI
ncbi:hypothetical protein AHAS_Ahas13G0345500 [Arachis hypogaea]